MTLAPLVALVSLSTLSEPYRPLAALSIHILAKPAKALRVPTETPSDRSAPRSVLGGAHDQ